MVGSPPDDEQPNVDELAAAIDRLRLVSRGRVVAVLIPKSWTPDMMVRLAQAMNRVLAAGEAGLKTVEDVLRG